VVKHCLVVGYTDDHTFLITIPHKDSRAIAAAHLNADLAILCGYGHHWDIKFTSLKASLLLISLKS